MALKEVFEKVEEQVKTVTGRFPTLCGMCGRYTKCGMYVTVVDNRITAVEPMPEHIGGKGFFCAKALGALEFQLAGRPKNGRGLAEA